MRFFLKSWTDFGGLDAGVVMIFEFWKHVHGGHDENARGRVESHRKPPWPMGCWTNRNLSGYGAADPQRVAIHVPGHLLF